MVEAWDRVVAQDYARQRINSERSLQASLWSQLNAGLPQHFRMFIEPRCDLDDGSRIYPDLVICNSRSVIGVVEIKYGPRGRPRYEADIRKLDAMFASRSIISLSNERFFGPSIDGRTYKMANHPLLVWAGFHRRAKDASYADLPSIASDCPGLRRHFMALHAETDAMEAPRTFARLY